MLIHIEVLLNSDDITQTLYHLENEYRQTHSEKLDLLIKRLRSLSISGREYVFFFFGLPELDESIILLMSDDRFFTACQLNNYTASLCRDEYFWEQRIWNTFEVDLEAYLRPEETLKQAYISLINPVRIRGAMRLWRTGSQAVRNYTFGIVASLRDRVSQILLIEG